MVRFFPRRLPSSPLRSVSPLSHPCLPARLSALSLEQHPPLADAVGARRELARDEAVQLAAGLLGGVAHDEVGRRHLAQVARRDAAAHDAADEPAVAHAVVPAMEEASADERAALLRCLEGRALGHKGVAGGRDRTREEGGDLRPHRLGGACGSRPPRLPPFAAFLGRLDRGCVAASACAVRLVPPPPLAAAALVARALASMRVVVRVPLHNAPRQRVSYDSYLEGSSCVWQSMPMAELTTSERHGTVRVPICSKQARRSLLGR